MKRPSRDQSVGYATANGRSIFNTNSSAAPPVAGATRIPGSFRRPEKKAIFPPSGDHTGNVSSAGSKVRRELTDRARSMIQTSRFGGVPVVSVTAACRSSGDNAMLCNPFATSPVLKVFPLRSNHISCRPRPILPLPRP